MVSAGSNGKSYLGQMTNSLLAAIGAFAVSVTGGWLALIYTRRAGLFDVPNQRSSHTIPTPRGGGIALVGAVVAVAWQNFTSLVRDSSASLFAVLGTIVGLTLLGWLDDRRSIRVGIRLCVHLACAAAVALLINEVAPFQGPANIGWLALWGFWTVASINIVNFMDGVDGMVATQGVVYGMFLFALTPSSTLSGRFGLILAGACLGFLVWNWAPARMFMGDAGSGPLGLFFVIGGALVLEGTPAALVFLPLFPLFLDALLTLIIRINRGDRITDAHRSHLYQRLANGGWGHARVTSVYAIAASIGALVGFLVRDSSALAMAGGIAIYTVSTVIGWKLLHDRFIEPSLRSEFTEMNS
jgi:UDP-N-acetylmuramyl pentapeptide phosphotransferase/UDP-N-acetylglucosamine-1-phosphate transferase